MTDSDDIKKANEDLSRLLRASIFPGAVSSFPKRSVTQEMLAQAEPNNPEYKCLPPRRPRPLAHRARIPAPSVGASARARSRGSAAVWQPRPAARQSNTARQRTLCVVLSAIRASTLVLCARLCAPIAEHRHPLHRPSAGVYGRRRGARTLPATSCCALDRSVAPQLYASATATA